MVEIQVEGNIPLYFAAALFFILIIMFIYFFSLLLSKKLHSIIHHNKMLGKDIQVINSDGTVLEKKNREKDSEKSQYPKKGGIVRKRIFVWLKVFFEYSFVFGLIATVIGIIIGNNFSMYSGIALAVFAVLILVLLILKKRKNNKNEISVIDMKENVTEDLSRNIPIHPTPLNDEDKKLLSKDLSNDRIFIIRKRKPKKKAQRAKTAPSEVKRFIKVVDNLLEKLPEEEIARFSKSSKFQIYKKIIKSPPARINDDLMVLAPMIDNMLEKLPEDEIKKFSQSRNFSLYRKMMGKLM
jgi:membrane protein implicated in regulation of membrane protease activity